MKDEMVEMVEMQTKIEELEERVFFLTEVISNMTLSFKESQKLLGILSYWAKFKDYKTFEEFRKDCDEKGRPNKKYLKSVYYEDADPFIRINQPLDKSNCLT